MESSYWIKKEKKESFQMGIFSDAIEEPFLVPQRTYKWTDLKEGVRGINRGMVTTVIRETPGFGIYFLAYDTLTRALGCDADADYIIPKLLLAGGMSGMASWISTYPVDVIKSRLQADGVGGANRYDGIVDCVRQSWRREGWRTFTRGLTSTLLRAFPVNATTFATVTLFLMYMRENDDSMKDCEPIVHWSDVPVCRGINRGMVTTVIRETPGFGIYFLAYDTLTRALGCDADADYIIPKLLLAGGMSGMASWISTYPVDVIKSRLQADGVGGANRYDGIVDCVRQSWRREGWRTFTRGLTSTLLRAFPVNATTFATVTLFLMYMRENDDSMKDCEPIDLTLLLCCRLTHTHTHK
uniref:Solute carrier family 25 member 29 n=1 Tax=Sinocyclocheilus grahami TaxID=75366 RepID=A0A672M714_SINGR